MPNQKHNLMTVVGDLSAKLATRSRHVCLLIGAGASVSAGLPDIAGLTTMVRDAISHNYRKQLESLLNSRNIEQALSRIRRTAALLDGKETFYDLTKESAAELDLEICKHIIEAIRSPKSREAFNDLGAWANRADYHRPLEIFTGNYDLLIEEGLENIGASYFDGFVGAINGYFRPDLVEALDSSAAEDVPPSFVRLWKIHGSSNWEWKDTSPHRRIVRLGQHAQGDRAIAIYPSDEKYDESRRIPFVVLMDRFRRALAEPETLLLTTGFSFSDQHVNEIIFESARRKPRSEFVLFFYSTIPSTVRNIALQTKNVTVIAAEEGIIGGKAGSWEIDKDVSGISENKKSKLGDFKFLASFLNRQYSSTSGTPP